MQSLHARNFNSNGRSGGNSEPRSKPMITLQCKAQDGLYLGSRSGKLILDCNLERWVMAKQGENRVTVISVRGSMGGCKKTW